MLEPYFPTPEIEEKVGQKHGLSLEELEEVFAGNPRIFLRTKRDRYGDRVYRALGRTSAGRYVTVFFVRETEGRARVITARDMDQAERRRYSQK
jgi:uncharacterized DUF497 family protein